VLRDRYEPMNIFRLVPALSFAIEPALARLDTLLDDDVLFQQVRGDLAHRCPRTEHDGRPSPPVEVVLRMLVVKHLYGWSYEMTERWINDSLVLRQFCRVYLETVPDDTTLLRWANLIQPETLHRLLDHVAQIARSLQVTRGRRLRTDGTVVETNIHYPTDSTLLGDGVRVVSRLLKQAQQVLGEVSHLGRDAFRDRRRSAQRQVRRITEAARRRSQQAAQTMRKAYRRLLGTAQAAVRQAQAVHTALKQPEQRPGEGLSDTLAHYLPLVEQVIQQTIRRVLEGEAVPAAEKVVSLFEPHTAIIRKGKAQCPTEFGHMVWLDEVEGGIISRYQILAGNPADTEQLKPSLDHHREVFKRPPHLVTGDRSLYSEENERYARTQGVKQVALPKPGAKSPQRQAHEKQPWFRRARRWRSGIEGRISLLKRRHKLRRCLYHGEPGMERWVGWGVMAHNLWVIAQATSH
jgi:IS5 family transposase